MFTPRPEDLAFYQKIVAHMRSTGEWGQFFPASLSPFGYNETMAYDEYPLSEQEAKAQGYSWYQEEAASRSITNPYVPEDTIAAYNEVARAQELTQGILVSSGNGKPFKVVSQELALYLKLGVPIPHFTQEERYQARYAKLSR